MLENHKTDEKIIEAIGRLSNGGTVSEIHAEMLRVGVDTISHYTIRRHLIGLRALGVVRRSADLRNGVGRTIYRKISSCNAVAENANR